MNKVSIALAEGVDVPEKGTPKSGAYDLKANITAPIKLAPGATALIPTGIFLDMGKSKGLQAILIPRSGHGHKLGLVLGNGTALVDNDFRGEVFVSAHNRNSPVKMTGMGVQSNNVATITIDPGMRLAQMMFLLVPEVAFDVVSKEELTETERGDGKLGSTGK